MKILNHQETTNWAKQREVELSFNPRKVSFRASECLEILLPEYPLRNAFLARMLVDLLWKDDISSYTGGLACITQMEIIGPPLETMGLKLVEKLTGNKCPDNKSGYLFDFNEKIDASIFLFNAMVFAWDAIWIPEKGNYHVFKSHDDVVYVMSINITDLDYFALRLAKTDFNVKKRETPAYLV